MFPVPRRLRLQPIAKSKAAIKRATPTTPPTTPPAIAPLFTPPSFDPRLFGADGGMVDFTYVTVSPGLVIIDFQTLVVSKLEMTMLGIGATVNTLVAVTVVTDIYKPVVGTGTYQAVWVIVTTGLEVAVAIFGTGTKRLRVRAKAEFRELDRPTVVDDVVEVNGNGGTNTILVIFVREATDEVGITLGVGAEYGTVAMKVRVKDENETLTAGKVDWVGDMVPIMMVTIVLYCVLRDMNNVGSDVGVGMQVTTTVRVTATRVGGKVVIASVVARGGITMSERLSCKEDNALVGLGVDAVSISTVVIVLNATFVTLASGREAPKERVSVSGGVAIMEVGGVCVGVPMITDVVVPYKVTTVILDVRVVEVGKLVVTLIPGGVILTTHVQIGYVELVDALDMVLEGGEAMSAVKLVGAVAVALIGGRETIKERASVNGCVILAIEIDVILEEVAEVKRLVVLFGVGVTSIVCVAISRVEFVEVVVVGMYLFIAVVVCAEDAELFNTVVVVISRVLKVAFGIGVVEASVLDVGAVSIAVCVKSGCIELDNTGEVLFLSVEVINVVPYEITMVTFGIGAVTEIMGKLVEDTRELMLASAKAIVESVGLVVSNEPKLNGGCGATKELVKARRAPIDAGNVEEA
ncbi:hypothetical protein B0J17DRAFT_743196 [Rhizoctonia solani]|nr:hypothetical protein B0J17DRAFT_743196 [Rhizoctonia solani]